MKTNLKHRMCAHAAMAALVALVSIPTVLGCSDSAPEADAAPSAAENPLTMSEANPANEEAYPDLTCDNPSRSFQCHGDGCCAAEPVCPSGRLPFDDPCGCGCLAARCQPGNRMYLSTSPYACSMTRPACAPEIEAEFNDECGCGCTDIENLPTYCDLPGRSFICKGLDCCAGINWVCEAGERGFADGCDCGCEG